MWVMNCDATFMFMIFTWNCSSEKSGVNGRCPSEAKNLYRKKSEVVGPRMTWSKMYGMAMKHPTHATAKTQTIWKSEPLRTSR